ncbi:MAG: sulfatase-like hydrolase/transferase [Pseudomonadota bacterium]
MAASFLGLWLVATTFWVRANFGNVAFEQLVYHLQYGANGLLEVDPARLYDYLLYAVLLPFIAAVVLTAGTARYRQHRPLRPLPWLIAAYGIGHFLFMFRFQDYASSFFGPDVFSSAYVDPKTVQIEPAGKQKNLVLIYVESLENSYQDPVRFGRDLLQPLTDLQQRYMTFGEYEEMPGTNWTVAGIVASQCGLPLKVMLGPNEPGLQLKQFVPHALCLGDVLAAQGYENVFLNGPDLGFARLGIFLKDHGYTRTYGAKEWAAAGEDRSKMKTWGLRDDLLFARARTELTQLMAGGKPFNLTILTVDTHGPDVLFSDECRHRGARKFEDVLGCTAGQLAEFIEFITSKGWLDSVSIVLQGDHLAMENPVFDKLNGDKHRRVFNLIITDPLETPSSPHMTHFDMFPTILKTVGFKTEAGRLGLGYCMLQSCDIPEPPQKRIKEFEAGILNRSRVYLSLWTG